MFSNTFSLDEFRKHLPKRQSDSHKGDNGRVLIIGGSREYYGAPILAGLSALGSGADLVYLLVPECNFEVTRGFYPDFIVRSYPGDALNENAIEPAFELLKKVDAVLIGPGIGKGADRLKVVEEIIADAACPIILDAEAIAIAKECGKNPDPRRCFMITPHGKELEPLLDVHLPEDNDGRKKIIDAFAKQYGITVLLKGSHDLIASPDEKVITNTTGNAGMTVGGTGDALAGCAASFAAQHMPLHYAAACAAFIIGTTGDELYKTKGSYFIASDVALELPYMLHRLF
ncbi:NAD(P)H-hydrate dehydratase [Candidatus Gracilibacteria bacterium]|nr:NAD(P)H-hydrate dehydratase [Candidatus Gracilibacteria bacterium]